MQLETVPYKGWERCLRLSNGSVDLVVTVEVGPRIIRFGFVGDDNEFAEYPEHLGQKGGDEWRIFGGHRLWHAPERIPRTYVPDNDPVPAELLSEGGVEFLRTRQPMEAATGIEKEMDIRLDGNNARVQITHRLRNCGVWPVELSIWALSVMAPGGTAILPMPPRQLHSENLMPVNTLTLWAYTDLSDPRWTLGPRFLLLHQDPHCTGPQKIGAAIPAGWAAFARNGHLFVKHTHYQLGATYPDHGCNYEFFTNDVMTEVESLSPMIRLEPGAASEHIETWNLLRDLVQPKDEMDVIEHILPVLKRIG